MPIDNGDKLPQQSFIIASDNGPKHVDFNELFSGKTVVIFGLPGAFTPTCSAKHLPSYQKNAAALNAKGVDKIICMSVNDAFVMQAWAKSQDISDDIIMLADGNCDFTKALGLELDGTKFGMGTRCQRFALLAKDGVVSRIFIEQAGEYKVSAAEYMLANI
ncbi:peroxiredoxin [Pseudaquidulcibacter saccharophilus]|uniref:peroxiredoxin n=1 Tax=Pseudaquidulcibacter saccharophilus TaxID=2831900 RepID=UPI001EFF465B|nr:peroxiredoxin [Pseudaquidulcibacter saccharophilus]